MSKAVQCDRCKKYLSLPKVHMGNTSKLIEGWEFIWTGDDWNTQMEPRNLCSACLTEFNDFMLGGEIQGLMF